MKKMFLFAIIFLTACSGQIPQVTVTSEVTVTSLPPTETPIPTPTLHPQFIALQDQIAASGERFYLTPDGSISDGATPVNGIQVGAEGKVTITVNGESVEIDPSIMNFDDENGLSIEGFEDADGDGEWEAAQLTPEEQLAVDLERWNMTGDKYNVEYDEEGKIELREKGTNRLVYWDGKWSSKVIVDMVKATNDCQATEFVPVSSTSNLVENKVHDAFNKYLHSVLVKAKSSTSFIRTPGYDLWTKAEPLRGTNNCWGVWRLVPKGDFVDFTWEKADGSVEVVDVFVPK